MRTARCIGIVAAVVGVVVAAWPHGNEPSTATTAATEPAREWARARPRKATASTVPVMRRRRTERPPDRAACPQGMTAVPDPVDPQAEPLACVDERGEQRGHWVAWGDLDRQAQIDAVRVLFADAQAHHAAERYDAAAATFLDAYRMMASPAFLYNAALCYEQAGHGCLAVAYWNAYLEQHPDSADAAKVLQRATALGDEYGC